MNSPLFIPFIVSNDWHWIFIVCVYLVLFLYILYLVSSSIVLPFWRNKVYIFSFLSLHFHKIILCEMQRTKRGMFSWYEILSWVQS